MQYKSVELLHKLADEFKALKLSFHVTPIRDSYSTTSMHYPHSAERLVDIDVITVLSEEELPYIHRFGQIETTNREPIVDFQDMIAETEDYFLNSKDAFNFNMGLNIEFKETYTFKIRVTLEETYINSFIESFRKDTEPLRLKAFEEEFDNQVEKHLEEEQDGDK